MVQCTVCGNIQPCLECAFLRAKLADAREHNYETAAAEIVEKNKRLKEVLGGIMVWLDDLPAKPLPETPMGQLLTKARAALALAEDGGRPTPYTGEERDGKD